MASFFRRHGDGPWYAKFKAWDAAKGAWVWANRSTHTTDRARAVAIASQWREVTESAKAGTMTRARALASVNDILRMAGVDPIVPVPSVGGFVSGLLSARNRSVGESTRRKYAAQWQRFEAWAGRDVDRPLDSWRAPDLQRYYAELCDEFSATTANDHMRFLSMVFLRAVKLGHMTSDPVAAVERLDNDSVEKSVLTRRDVVAVLRSMRRQGRRDWCSLVLLGWHTGHRLQDLLTLTAGAITFEREVGWIVEFRPAKTARGNGRTLRLPLPRHLAKTCRRLGDFQSIHHANNRNGVVSEEFVAWLKTAGVDPLPVKRGKRIVHLKSFHSLRHAMASRLAAAGISGDLARMVTGHESAQVARRYQHAEIAAIKEAMDKARRRG